MGLVMQITADDYGVHVHNYYDPIWRVFRVFFSAILSHRVSEISK